MSTVVEHTTVVGLKAIAITGVVLLGFGILRCLGDAIAVSLVVVLITGHTIHIRPALLPGTGMRIPVHHIRTARVVSPTARPWAAGAGGYRPHQPPPSCCGTGPHYPSN